jgi:hypothetical protein
MWDHPETNGTSKRRNMSQNEQKDKVLTNGFFVKSHPAQTGWWYAYPSEKSWSERQLG